MALVGASSFGFVFIASTLSLGVQEGGEAGERIVASATRCDPLCSWLGVERASRAADFHSGRVPDCVD